MTPAIINVLIGAVLKVGAFMFTSWLEDRSVDKQRQHEQNLALINAKNNRYHEAHFDDTAHDSTRFTRRGLGWMVLWTFCLLAGFCVYYGGNEIIEVQRTPGFFEWLTGSVDTTTRPTSLRIWTMDKVFTITEIVIGFFFTPVGRHSAKRNG